MSWRGDFLKTCSDRGLSYEVIISYSQQMRDKPDEEKEKIALRLIKEIEAKYPLAGATKDVSNNLEGNV